jgi:hypothetical protein
VPIWHWKDADKQIAQILSGYGLGDSELHTAWMLRKYLEQSRIANFDQLSRSQRRATLERYRAGELLRLQRAGNPKAYRQQKKNYQHTASYVHLTYSERIQVVRDIADAVGAWGFARLFAECIDKLHFDPVRAARSIGEQAFEQVISRFEKFLQNTHESANGQRNYGLLVHDNNETISRKHTDMMRRFHKDGTLWTHIERIIETPLFVDSRLTRLVQVADLCSYALRRYVEQGDTDLFHRIFQRADRFRGVTVGVRHYTTPQGCSCDVCKSHQRPVSAPT